MQPAGSQGTIVCDVDGVVADLTPAWLDALFARHPECPDPRKDPTWDSWDIADVVPQRFLEPLFEILGSHEVYDTVRPILGGLDGIMALRNEGFRIVFVTSCVIGHAGAKLKWLVKHGFLETVRHNYDYVECSDKTLIRGSLIIDDRPKTCHDFQRQNGFGSSILFMQRQLHPKHTKGLFHVESWPGVYHRVMDLHRKRSLRS